MSEKLLGEIRVAPWWVHILAITVTIASAIWVTPGLMHLELLSKLSDATSQWLDERFVSMLIVQFFRIVVVLFLIGRLRPQDIGVTRQLILPAMLVLLFLWVSVQALYAIEGLAATGSVVTHNPLGGEKSRFLMAKAVVVGSVCEELLMRGFFMLQWYKITHERLSLSLGVAALFSIVASAVMFAFMHIPGRILVNAEAFGDILPFLGRSLLVGVTLGVVFARTGNIIIAAGLHCFLNLPMNVVSAPEAIPYPVQWGIDLIYLVIAVHFITLTCGCRSMSVLKSPDDLRDGVR